MAGRHGHAIYQRAAGMKVDACRRGVGAGTPHCATMSDGEVPRTLWVTAECDLSRRVLLRLSEHPYALALNRCLVLVGVRPVSARRPSRFTA
jgi:hypothetical protein